MPFQASDSDSGGSTNFPTTATLAGGKPRQHFCDLSKIRPDSHRARNDEALHGVSREGFSAFVDLSV